MKKKTGVLLINLGTPANPDTSSVRRYLSEFLNDPRVIDISWLARKLLVNLIIVPFRAPKSAKIYQQLWGERGSPLLYYGNELREKLNQKFGEEVQVELAMRYQEPSIPSVLRKMKKADYDKIIILPLFPQYASSSTGSALQKAMEVISKWWVIPEVSVISQYYNHPGYINAFAERGRQYDLDEYDHILFSYHGLPVRQVDKVYEDGKSCEDHNCEQELNESNKFCYKAVCYETTRQLVKQLGIPEDKYSVGFQSRLGNAPWIEPFADELIEKKAEEGVKKMLVFSPAFVADCLETTIEIGVEYKELFEEYGGEKLQLVESLNDHPLWIDALEDIIKQRL